METEDNPDNKQICRLCLDIVPDADAEAIEEKKKTILEVLLINIDLHVTENAVACSRCTEKLQTSFEFKSACLHVDNCISTFVDADIPVDIKKVFHGEVRGTAMANVNLENTQICRLCMSLITDKALDCNLDLKDIIANCLPEVDIHTVHEPLVCELCVSQMKRLHELMNACQEVERRINNYCQVASDRAIPISLNDLLKFKNSTISGIIKEECSNSDNNVLKDVKKEDTASIECEEIHIKTELGSGDEMEESLPSGAYNNSGKRRRQKRECTSKGRNHFTSDGHRKYILARHTVKYKDKSLTSDLKSEVETYKCDICEFETRYKRNMIRHMLKHRDPNAERKFKCDKCPYGTDFRGYLHKHNMIHKKKSEVKLHKCESCEYETRHKRNMKRHVRGHKVKHCDLKAKKKFMCDKCLYQTDFKAYLRRHSMMHKKESEVKLHKCGNCGFETRYKSNFNKHMLKHRDAKI